MDNLDVIQVPTLSLLSSSSNNTSSDQPTLPKTINKFVKKKLYKRPTTRTSPNSSSLRRSSSSKSSPPYKNRRHKRRTLYYKDGAKSSFGNFLDRGKSRKSSSSTDTTPSSTRSVVSPVAATSNRSTSTISSTRRQRSTPNRESLDTPQSEQDLFIIESDNDDNENPITPSPIRDSPSYGRKSKRRDASSSATILASSSSLYPQLPTETSRNFVCYHPNTKDDTTIDSELIDKIRKGPKGEVWNRKLGQIYTAVMEGETGHVKIGWTEQEIQQRMTGLNSPKRSKRIYDEPDTTPGAQSRHRNCYFAEQIIHLELYNFRRRAVERNDTEWFERSIKEAHRVCRKWRNWLIQCKPYDENQQLTGFWRERLEQMASYDPYDVAKHGCLHDRWMDFLNPSWWDMKSYEILITWRKINDWWTWICENYIIILVLLGIVCWASNGVLSFLLFIFIVLVTCAGLSRTTKEERKGS